MRTAHKILGALWFFQVVNYVDRVAISFAAPSIMSSMQMSHESFGLILSSFSIGYTLGQIPGGMLADRWGARRLMILAPILWALLTGMTGLVSTLAGFILVRALFGLSEGLSNSCGYKTIGDNFTSQQRSTAVAVWATAFAVAPMLAGPLVGLILADLGWRWLFAILALPALVVSAVNYFLIPRAPSREVHVKSAMTSSLGSLLKKPSLWVLGIAYLSFNIAYWGYLGWMPSYLSSAHDIKIKELGLLGAIPYAFALAGLIIAGRLGSGLFYRHRPHMLIAYYLLAAIGLYLAYSATTLAGSLAGLSAAAFFLYGSLSSFGAIVLELAPEEGRATYSAAVTTLGQVGGILAPWIIGMLVGSSGNFALGFAFMASGLGLAAVLITCLLPAITQRMAPPSTP